MIRSIPKPVRVKDPAYLAHIRTLPCLLHDCIGIEHFHTPRAETISCDGFTHLGQVPDPYVGVFTAAIEGRYRVGWIIVTEAAHVRGKGAGGGDEQVIPLCGKHHRWGKYSLHNLNVAGFDKHWNTNVKKTARELRRAYLKNLE